MNTCVVKDDDGLSIYIFREIVQIRHDFILSDVFLGNKSVIFIIPAYKPKEIQTGSLLNRDRYVFVLELPAIGNMALRTDMAFISEEKVYMTLNAISSRFQALSAFPSCANSIEGQENIADEALFVYISHQCFKKTA